ncbi:23S rRNA methyltransferase [Pokkaliibacter plantistimulans]|uniref:23S rRNA (guanosine-2'-O-)-methyltransferase RlmB n=2 Tax=Pseudomonadota TaxID=1224 RepID=A0ABX5M2P2_9GAMM|nr:MULTISPECIES: 23S rRNA (guanosine(2251)-2'-O)-methyltransferase RlmB [Pokkaliibacter]MDH2432214.1 23S rRNA (guanosine(2251)-2'-O)-methyltransferase RlmB [Pokkaliibacter sp. MBI-7]PPC74410.1 23S rRNA (guanosine(2251)-2'-O)-methyltransferase RlmB [Pokkaliibacter plantistimulans]PXF32003.1 23S rRNA methyltransferase [Pokkaliibacter plantistimulans]
MSQNLDWAFGLHSVQTLLKRDAKRIRELWVQQGRRDQRIETILELAQSKFVKVKLVSRQELDAEVEGVHQGVAAKVEPQRAQTENWLETYLDQLEDTPFILVLDGVTDPHNLGACLRTADAAGVHAVIAPKDKSAPLNSTAVKVACGAAEAVPYVQVTNLARTLRSMQERGIWMIGTAGEAEQTVYEANLKGPMALIMGAEGSGMRRLTRECCDTLVSIPMAGEVSSLNVSVATGVCLFEAVRQRQL